MSDNKLYLIDTPNDEPTNIDDYKKQNNLIYKTTLLSLGFDGVKLANWLTDNTDLPYIIAGSIIEFEGNLYEARNDIELVDECSDDTTDRFIVFYKSADSEYLEVKIVDDNFPVYNLYKRGFYTTTSDGTEKYLRVSMLYENGLYRSKNYWDKDDINRYNENTNSGGGNLIFQSQVFSTAGTHSFEFPLNATSITIHIMAGGGPGGGYASNSDPTGTDGGTSSVSIGSNTITSCTGGKCGCNAISGGIVGIFSYVGGDGGVATGRGLLYDGEKGSNGSRPLSSTGIEAGNGLGASSKDSTKADGGNGGNGYYSSSYGRVGAGGGSAACAIFEVLRSEMGDVKHLTIVIGTAGIADYTYSSGQTNGEAGSAYLEWYE